MFASSKSASSDDDPSIPLDDMPFDVGESSSSSSNSSDDDDDVVDGCAFSDVSRLSYKDL
jgi:hypothetical protein